jgi:hypothetical protein
MKPVTEKQLVLIYNTFLENGLDGEQEEEYIERISGKAKHLLEHDDVGVFLNVNDNQKRYFLEIIDYIKQNIDPKVQISDDYTRNIKDYTRVIKDLALKYRLFLPRQVNKRVIEYTFETISMNGDDTDYFIGIQSNKWTGKKYKVFGFKCVLVLDWDECELKDIKNLLTNNKTCIDLGLIFRIYQTYNGYHAYCTNKFFNHESFGLLQLMYTLQCDPMYISFVKHYGFIVRLSSKGRENEDFIECYKDTVYCGDNTVEYKSTLELLVLKDSSFDTCKRVLT